MKGSKKFLYFFLVISLALIPVYKAFSATKAYTDTGYLGNDQWYIQTDGDMVPATDSSQDLGESGSEIDNIYADSIWLGGVELTGWGSTVTPWTDYTGYTALTDGGTDTKMYDDGDITIGGGTATDVVITWDSDSNDYYIGTNDTENELQIGYGSVMGTTEQISITTGAKVYLGEDTDVDFGLIFQSGSQDYYQGIDYTGGQEEDLLCIGPGSTVGSSPAIGVGTTGIVYLNHIDAPGDTDFDVGSADMDDFTIVTDGGTLILDGTITLTSSEVISNATDDTVRIASNDLDTVLEVYTPYDTDGDATLKLSADLGDAAGEQWTITSTGSSTDLVFGCDDSVSGTPVTTFTIADNGIVTSTNYIENKITDSGGSAVADVCKLTHDGGTAAAGVGAGLVWQIDDAGGIEEQGSIDVSLSTVTNGSEQADMTVSLNTAGTVREVLKIDTDHGVTGGTVFEATSWTSETNGVIDIVELTLDNTLDTATDDFGAGIVWKLEQADSGTPVEHASLDVVITSSTTAAEDTDIVFSQVSAGNTVEETLRLVAADAADASDYLKYTGNSSETDGIVDIVQLRLSTSGTPTTNLGAGIAIQLDDATGIEEKASIDFQMTDATRASCDTDIIFKQDMAGALTQSFLIEADGAHQLSSANANGTSLTIMTADGNTTADAKLVLDADAGGDNADTWTLESEANGNDFTINNHATEVLNLTSAGALQIDSTLSVDGDAIDCDGTYLKLLSASTKYHKYHYYPIAYVSATQARVGGGAEPLLCAGLSGVDEIGSTQGYVSLIEDADTLRFRFHLPETFIDTGTQEDLILQFYVSEQITIDAATFNVTIYEFGSTTAILSDQVTVLSGDSAGWVNLVTNAAGIGNNTDIDADDILIITVSPQTLYSPQSSAHDSDFYGCRIKYATGIEATQ